MPLNPIPGSVLELIRPANFIAGELILQNAIVTFEADGKVDNADLASDIAIGVAQEAAAADLDELSVQTTPGAKVTCIAGAAIAVGATLMPSAAVPGRVLTRVDEAQNTIVGYALTAAAAAGEDVQVLFLPTPLLGSEPLLLTAGEAILANAVVKYQADSKVDNTAAVDDEVFGVAITAAAADTDPIQVQTQYGVEVTLIAGAAITAGDLLMPSGAVAGRVLSRSATDTIVGTALDLAALAGDNFQAIFAPRHVDV